jgi:hypothetical protein
LSSLLPHDFWTRLALLDARCTVAVYSTFELGEGRFWTANARRRDDPARFVEVSGDSMMDALLRLLVAAEAAKLSE